MWATEQYGICSVSPGQTARPPAALATVSHDDVPIRCEENPRRARRCRSCGSVEGDAVAEVVELLDVVVASAVGVVAADEVVAAEVVVVGALVSRCQQITRMEWLTATAAFFLPMRRARRQNWAER